YQSYLVIILDGRKRKYSAKFCNKVFFKLSFSAKHSRNTYIKNEHYSQFPFFFKNFHIWMTEPRCNIPVNSANIVATHIFPDLTECHSSSFECTVVFTGKNMRRQSARLDFYLTNFF